MYSMHSSRKKQLPLQTSPIRDQAKQINRNKPQAIVWTLDSKYQMQITKSIKMIQLLHENEWLQINISLLNQFQNSCFKTGNFK